MILVGFLCNTVVAQTTTEKPKCKNRADCKKCSDDKAKNAVAKTPKLTIKQKLSLLVQKKIKLFLKMLKESTSKNVLRAMRVAQRQEKSCRLR